jgi:hypothetical protein
MLGSFWTARCYNPEDFTLNVGHCLLSKLTNSLEQNPFREEQTIAPVIEIWSAFWRMQRHNAVLTLSAIRPSWVISHIIFLWDPLVYCLTCIHYTWYSTCSHLHVTSCYSAGRWLVYKFHISRFQFQSWPTIEKFKIRVHLLV